MYTYGLLPTAGVIALIVTSLGYICYRAALPRPIPGIPYNKKSARRILGDAPDLFKYKAENGELFAYMYVLQSAVTTMLYASDTR